jgi:hypothetical protein
MVAFVGFRLTTPDLPDSGALLSAWPARLGLQSCLVYFLQSME